MYMYMSCKPAAVHVWSSAFIWAFGYQLKASNAAKQALYLGRVNSPAVSPRACRRRASGCRAARRVLWVCLDITVAAAHAAGWSGVGSIVLAAGTTRERARPAAGSGQGAGRRRLRLHACMRLCSTYTSFFFSFGLPIILPDRPGHAARLLRNASEWRVPSSWPPRPHGVPARHAARGKADLSSPSVVAARGAWASRVGATRFIGGEPVIDRARSKPRRYRHRRCFGRSR
jgi:hypothetical protein